MEAIDCKASRALIDEAIASGGIFDERALEHSATCAECAALIDEHLAKEVLPLAREAAPPPVRLVSPRLEQLAGYFSVWAAFDAEPVEERASALSPAMRTFLAVLLAGVLLASAGSLFWAIARQAPPRSPGPSQGQAPGRGGE